MFPFTCLSLASWSGAWTHPPYHTTYCTFFIQLRSGSRAIQPIADPCLLLESEVIKSYMWPQAPDYLGLLWLKRYMPTRDLSVGTLHGEATWWLYLFCKQCLQTSWVMYRIYYCRNVSWRKDANWERSPVDKASSNLRPMVEPRAFHSADYQACGKLGKRGWPKLPSPEIQGPPPSMVLRY